MLIVCSNCQSNIHVPQGTTAKKGKCPRCGTILVVPPAVDAPPAPPAEPPAAQPAAPPPVPETAYASEIPPPLPAAEPPPVPRTPRRYDTDDEPVRRRYDHDEDDDDDLSIRRPRRRQTSKAMGVTAMVLGCIGLLLSGVALAAIVGGIFGLGQQQPDLCCYGCLGGNIGLFTSGLLGLLGLIFGFIGMGQSGRGFALTGIVTGGLALLMVLAYLVLILLMMFGVIVAAGAAANAQQNRQPFPQPRPR